MGSCSISELPVDQDSRCVLRFTAKQRGLQSSAPPQGLAFAAPWQRMAGHANAKTTGLYDRRNDDTSLSEVERVGFESLMATLAKQGRPRIEEYPVDS